MSGSPSGSSRAEELRFFFREGHRLCKTFMKLSEEMNALTHGDAEAAVETMVGCAVCIVQETGCTTEAAVAGLAGLYPSEPTWAPLVLERVRQEISNAPHR
jgi:hypothetical protein